MTTDTKNLLFFLSGVGIGATTAWLLLRKKLRKEKQEEVNELREVYRRKEEELKKREEELNALVRKNDEEKGPDIESYMAKRKAEFEEARKGYFDMVGSLGYSDPDKDDEPDEEYPKGAPYIITPREFGERDGFDIVSYTYFADGVLADELGEEMAPEEIEDTIGADALTHFGDYEEDSVYVRNERHRCDYSVLLDERDYEEYLETRPKIMVTEDV